MTSNFTEQSGFKSANRDWIEIIESILEICKNGSLKTHIMYNCDLNSKQTGRYLQFLEDHNFLEKGEDCPYSDRIFYKTTEKGKRFIEAYGQLEKVFE